MQQKRSHSIPWTILGVASLMSFAMWAPLACVPPMEHILKEELFLTHAQTSLFFNAPFIMMAALSLIAGIIADRIGIRRAAGIAAIIIAIGSILRGTATGFGSLLAFTFIYGAGLALAWPNLIKLVSLWAPRERAVAATGIYIAASYVGFSLPPAITMSLIFPITNTFRGAFLIWGTPTIIAAIVWWGLMREPPSERLQAEQVDGANMPFRQIFRNNYLWLVSTLFLLNQFFFYTWFGWAPTLMMLKGASPNQAGLIASLFLWVGIPSCLLVPKFSNKLGLRKPFLWVPSIILAFNALGAIYVTVPMGWLFMALAGVTYCTRFVTIMALPIEMMPKKAVGTTSGLMFSIGYIGGIIGPLVGGHILDITGSLDLSFFILVGVSIATAGIAFRLPETGPKARGKH